MVVFFILFGLLLGYFRKALDAYQTARPRYAAERAVALLEQKKNIEAVDEIPKMLNEWPIRRGTGGLLNPSVDNVWEGPVMRNRVTVMQHLAEMLFARELSDPAEKVEWKTILEYHVASRILEPIHIWEWMFHIKVSQTDYSSAFEIMKILGAHGAAYIRKTEEIQPDPLKVPDKMYDNEAILFTSTLVNCLQQYYQCETPADFNRVIDKLRQARDLVTDTMVRQRLNEFIHQGLIRAGRRADARTFFQEVLGRDLTAMDRFWHDWPQVQQQTLVDRDPTLLSMMWHDRPAATTMTLNDFMDSFGSGDPRVRVVNFNTMNRKDIGYFNLKNMLYQQKDKVVMAQAIAGSMQVELNRPVHRIYIAYESTSALGIWPILLVRISESGSNGNDTNYYPLYCDSEKPDLCYFDVDLKNLGTYNFEFVYLNDAEFNYVNKHVRESRDLHLFRMALIQVPPSE